MRRPGPDVIEDTEADHLDIGHAVLAVQGEGPPVEHALDKSEHAL